MSPGSPSRLWPVLVGLIVLLSAAAVLEVLARAQGGDQLVISLSSEALDLADDEDGGEAETSSALQTPPVDADHARARRLLQRGQLADGLALLAEVTKRHPAQPGLRAELGYWLLRSKQAAEAIAQLKLAKRSLPEDARTALWLGKALARSGDPSGAERELRRALRLRPAFNRAQLALGNLLLKRDRAGEAFEVFQAAVESGSNEERATAELALGRAQLQMGRAEGAEQAFEHAIQLAPARPDVRLIAARAWLRHGGPAGLARAEGLLDEAERLAPDLPAIYTTLGRIKERRGELDSAEAAYFRAVRLDPDRLFARRRLLRLGLERRDLNLARVQADRLLAARPDDQEVYFLAGLVANRQGDLDSARKFYQTAIDKAGGLYPEAHFNLGRLERKAGRLDAAIAAYRSALADRKDYPEARNNLGLALAAAGRAEVAEETYRQLNQAHPTYVPAWINLGKLLSSQDRYPEAIAAYETALGIAPGQPRALLDLGVAQARSGRLEEAIRTYQDLLERRPRRASGWYNLGLALAKIGRRTDAEEALRRALAINPDHIGSLRKLARLQTEAGQLAQATGSLVDLLDRRPADRSARLALADLRRRTADRQACLRETERVLRESPEDPEAKALRGLCAQMAGHGSQPVNTRTDKAPSGGRK